MNLKDLKVTALSEGFGIIGCYTSSDKNDLWAHGQQGSSADPFTNPEKNVGLKREKLPQTLN